MGGGGWGEGWGGGRVCKLHGVVSMTSKNVAVSRRYATYAGTTYKSGMNTK